MSVPYHDPEAVDPERAIGQEPETITLAMEPTPANRAGLAALLGLLDSPDILRGCPNRHARRKAASLARRKPAPPSRP